MNASTLVLVGAGVLLYFTYKRAEKQNTIKEKVHHYNACASNAACGTNINNTIVAVEDMPQLAQVSSMNGAVYCRPHKYKVTTSSGAIVEMTNKPKIGACFNGM